MDDQNQMDDTLETEGTEEMEDAAAAAPAHTPGHTSSADEAEVAELDEDEDDEEEGDDEEGEEEDDEEVAS